MKLLFKGVAPIIIYIYDPMAAMPYIILEDNKYKGVRYIINSNSTHPTAYIGIGTRHRLAGRHYDRIDINVHGGLTYSAYSGGYFLPKGYYWIGWDYAHAGDYTAHDKGGIFGDKKWTYKEILTDVLQAIDQFKKL